jgi:hypothetical protein
MDARNFLSHLHSRRPVPLVGTTTTGLPAHHAAAPPASRAPVAPLPAARPQGMAGKPPYGKDRYPASFAGRPKGAKSKAPNRRQMYSALAAAIAMKSGDAKYEADATNPDFLERFGVKRAVITRITNGLVSGDVTMHQAMSDFSSSAERAGHSISGFATVSAAAGGAAGVRAGALSGAASTTTTTATTVTPLQQAATAEITSGTVSTGMFEDDVRNITADPPTRHVTRGAASAAARTAISNRQLHRAAKAQARQGAPAGQESTAGGALMGGDISTRVPTAAVTAPVSTVLTPEANLPGAAGAGGGSSSNGVGLADSGFPSLFGANFDNDVDEVIIEHSGHAEAGLPVPRAMRARRTNRSQVASEYEARYGRAPPSSFSAQRIRDSL